jgi:hypothetical protein
MFKTDTSTTGKVVSSLGVLTCLSLNLLDNRLDEAEREQAHAEMRAICMGQRGVHPDKVTARSIERCANGVWN